MLRALSELTEQGTRVGEFMLARKKGKGLVKAGRAAQEVSVNFDRHGAKTTALRGLAAFLERRAYRATTELLAR